MIVAVAGVIVAGSFLIKSGGDEPAAAKRGGGSTPVTTVPIVSGPITERGRYPGELDADATDVAAFYAGRLISVRVRVGDTVKQRDVVAELDPVDAKEQIAQARAQARAAAADGRRATVERDAAIAEADRLEPLARDKLISALEIDKQRARANALRASAEAAAAGGAEAQARVRLLEKRLVESVVRAPFAGRVAERYVDPGAIVTPGTRLVRIVQIAPLRVRFEVPEHEVAGLTTGTALRVVTQPRKPDGRGPAADPATGVLAKVSGVASEINRERRIAVVEALIEDPPAGWLPGMYAEAIVDRRTIDKATIFPAAAVLSRLQPNGTVVTGVFVADGEVARWVPITEVARDGDRVAVEGAPTPDGRVLIAGHVELTDGSRIKPSGGSAARPEAK
ncbi:MAG: efflux RND transporter periplasmic adaptor subunit [Myxococcota bacterium]|nr:efflux RND transporter periplasmic adaptor subunit [Myxococcota bacterium]